MTASEFYTGLIAQLYEPLLSRRAKADDYAPFLERSGFPALELACGTGLPLLELVSRGHHVEGLDASADMLAICRAKARAAGLNVTLHHQEMQRMDLPVRYRSIFLADASFSLLLGEDDARATLTRAHDHLLPGGSLLLPMWKPDTAAIQKTVGRSREVVTEDGTRLRVQTVRAEVDPGAHIHRTLLRYERQDTFGHVDSVEAEWRFRWWEQEELRALLQRAGFAAISCTRSDGRRARPEDTSFTFVARRGS